MNRQRSQLLWFGDGVPADLIAACDDRDLRLVRVASGQDLTNVWPNAQGAVVSLPEGAPCDVRAVLSERTLQQALWHGLQIIVLSDLGQVKAVKAHLGSLPYGGMPQVWTRALAMNVAKALASHSAGAPWSSGVEIVGDEGLCEEDRVLVRRAFNDCTSVKLQQIDVGRSAAVFRAFAHLRDSRAGPRPLPFFVKLDRYPKIEREIGNYRSCTTLFVPFMNRPNLDDSRCALGAERGIIVGNFVENAESLPSLVSRGAAHGAITSLFDDALRGWRWQAYSSDKMFTRPLIASLPGIKALATKRLEVMNANAVKAREFGARFAPTELIAAFEALAPIAHRCTLMHGDLHGENVQVRGGSAILIDFASVQDGPLVADPAALDVSIAFGAKGITADHWSALVEKLFAQDNLTRMPPPMDTAELGAPLWNTARVIRRVGLSDEISKGEYLTAVALYLMRHAMFRESGVEESKRRSLAYAFAERLVRDLSSRKTDD